MRATPRLSRPPRAPSHRAGPRARALPVPPRTRGRLRDRGVASLEFLGMLPFLLLIALAGIQLGIAAYCGEQAGTAARTAARTAAEANPRTDPQAAGEDAVSGWVNVDIDLQPDRSSVTANATVQIPSVMPGLSFLGPVTRTATMPKEDDTQ
ncbi:TadE/TadG family type IV pilus assembly protein [Streptomyces polygonati]|uniref:TadE/TadG family type IV pilus assembly protein n=1 Tax=Streptomyces polygonati TaxID=1617087 RepID=A0ABV8HKZ9_9ACTN